MNKILFIMPFTIPVTEFIGDNTGNYVYYLAVYSYLFGTDNLTCMSINDIQQHLETDPEYIRKNYDIAIMAEANLFAVCYKDNALIDNANFIKTLKIPCYILGIGCQNDIDNNIKNLVSINDQVKNYVDTILASGGMLTLRGNLTADYLKSLGYSHLPVFGCPSMYINGLSFKISDKKVTENAFKPMFNAQFVDDLGLKLYEDWPDSAFFDQDRYLKSLFFPLKAKEDECLQNELFIKLYKQGRIRGDINYYPWLKQIKDNGFNFAYGSRIHGNVIAIQAGIPAFVKVIDSRTREIADFYGIPNSLEYRFNETKDSLYDLYKSINYDKFNKGYVDKYNKFKHFLTTISGVENRTNNDFMSFLASKKYPEYNQNYQSTPEGQDLIRVLEEKNHLSKKGGLFMKKLSTKSQKTINSNQMPKISVIMACYNSADFVEKSIQSVINQTYSNWELLCVNDMSQDNTLQILNEYAKKDSRIKVFNRTERGGRAAPNYNLAIDNATGDFMCLVDHDDTISPDLFECEIKRQQETGADIIIPDCMLVYPDEPEKNWVIAGITDAWAKPNKKTDRDIILSSKAAVELSLTWRIHGFNLVRSSIMKQCKYCEDGMNGDEYSARVFYLYANKIAFSQGTYFYYQIPSSITKKLTPRLWDVYKTPYLLEKLLIDNNFPYYLISSIQSSRVSLYKSLLEKYEKYKKDISVEDRKKIEFLLLDNEKLLKEIDISQFEPKKHWYRKIFSVKKDFNIVTIRILGIKLKYKVKKI